jgi:hypothetical protein
MCGMPPTVTSPAIDALDCSTKNEAPATVNVAERRAPVVVLIGATHEGSPDVFHVQPAAVVTVIVPAPPTAGNAWPIG